MHNTLIKPLFSITSIIALSLLFSACSSQQKIIPSFTQACPEIRSEMCTFDFRPVCGFNDDGSKKTYSNACVACSTTTSVQGYDLGECK